MRVNVLVGGPIDLLPLAMIKKRQAEVWIGVDRGAITLVENNIIPAAAIGDFDSISSNALASLQDDLRQVDVSPPEKDYTDTQLGVKLAINKYQPEQIDVFGATGGRLDHLLANVFLPLQKEFIAYLPKIRLIDVQNTVSYYLPGSYTVDHEAGKKYLAFVNLTPVKGLTLVDEKYPLTDWDGDIPFSWTSNEFTAPQNHFTFEQGVVAVIQCADRL